MPCQQHAMHGYLGFHGTDGPRTRARDAARARHAARAGARRRALLAGAVAAAVALQGGWQDQGTGAGSAEAPPPVPGQGNAAAGRMDAPGRLRAAVEREAARLREALDAAEAGQDLRSLARRRLTVDAVLVPIHLVRDAMEMAMGGVDADLLRFLRAEWRSEPPHARWSHAGAAARARASLAAALGMDGAGTLRLRARVALLQWTGAEAPPAVDWEIEGRMSPAGPAVTARCLRVIPASDPEHVGFPLPSTGFTLHWDRDGARYDDGAGNRHAERWATDAAFINPPDLYAVFDGLRAERSGDRNCRSAATAADEAPSAPIESVRTMERADGSPLRTERWSWDGSRLASVSWSQHALAVVHQAPQASEIVTDAGDGTVSRTPHRPTSMMAVPPIEAVLRAEDAPGKSMTFEMAVDGEPWAVGRIEVLSPAAPWPADPHAGAEAGNLVRAIGVALESGAPADLALAADMAEAYLFAAEAPHVQRCAERELLARRMHAAGHADAARMLLSSRWLRDVRAGEAPAAVERWCEALDRPFASLLGEAAGITGCADGASGRRAEEAPCDLAAAGSGCEPLARCVLDAVRETAMDGASDRTLRVALCEACARGELPALDDAACSAIGAELRDALRTGLAVALAADAGTPIDRARALVHRTCEAAARPAAGRDLRDSMRRGWGVISAAALAALRDASQPDAVDGARRMLKATEDILGNRFHPALDALSVREPPGRGTMRDALAVRIQAALAAEARRGETVARLLGPAVEADRSRSSARRIAEAAVAAAVDEYLRWARGPGTAAA